MPYGIRVLTVSAFIAMDIIANRNAVQRPNILSRINAWVSSRFRKTDVGRAHDTINPLWNLTERQVEMFYDVARTGNNTMLQYLYNEIENNDPTLLICASRRAAALSELDWKVVKVDRRRMRKFDKALADEQIACLEESISNIDNFPDAVEHLALAPLRGYSAVAPVWGLNGGIKHIDSLDTWNLCYSRSENVWLWNPDARAWSDVDSSGSTHGLEVISPEQMVMVTKKRAIDWPAMKIYLRMSVGERDWGRFLETYGLPPVIITMPELTTDDEVDKYMKAAEAVFEGKSGVVPFGSQVSYGSESRGTNPFTEFIEHQQKLVVMMATGGTLTSLAESGSGTLAGGAQMDVWRQIVRSDAKVIGNAINKQMCGRIIAACHDFKDKPVLAEFQFETEPPAAAKDVLELAGMADQAGFMMDAEELAQKTGYKITRKPVEGGVGFNDEVPPNAGKSPVEELGGEEATLPMLTVANAASGKERAKSATEKLAASLQHDFKGVADELAKILALPEAERPGAAALLLGRLDELVPDDPAMAEVIEEQMVEAFGEQIKKEM